MATIVNGTDIDTIANVQDGGGGGGEDYSLGPGKSVEVEVENAKVTFASDDPAAETELGVATSVRNSDTVTLVAVEGGTYTVEIT